jgi:hypothetical protein
MYSMGSVSVAIQVASRVPVLETEHVPHVPLTTITILESASKHVPTEQPLSCQQGLVAAHLHAYIVTPITLTTALPATI